jgi:hypothetical protein
MGVLPATATAASAEVALRWDSDVRTWRQKRKGCGAHHKTGRELLRAALRFARVPQKHGTIFGRAIKQLFWHFCQSSVQPGRR